MLRKNIQDLVRLPSSDRRRNRFNKGPFLLRVTRGAHLARRAGARPPSAAVLRGESAQQGQGSVLQERPRAPPSNL